MRSFTGRVALLTVLAMIVASCTVNINEAGAGGAAGGGGDGDSGTAVNQEEDIGTVSVAGAPTGVEGEAIQTVIDEQINANAEYAATYTGSDGFEQNVQIQIEGGTPPDIGLFPQPGTVQQLASEGSAIALEDLGFDMAELEGRFGAYLMSLGEFEGKHYGYPTNVNFKSAIWYNVPAFEAAGYEPVETWEDLIALSDQIVADGKNPWCIGSGSDAATGWPATDWMEDIVLRQAGTEVYDQWVAGDVTFSSPEITAAAETFGEVLFTEDYVFGGSESITGSDFRDAPDPMFQDDPPCYLHRQASFITTFFPGAEEEATALTPIEDYNFFKFPTIEGQDGVLIAGEFGVVFNNRAEVRGFLEAFGGADAQCAQGGFEGISRISPNTEVGADCYNSELLGEQADATTTALAEDIARFDASDLMPPEVGGGSFWTGMNDYTDNGPDNLEQVLSGIDAGWPGG